MQRKLLTLGLVSLFAISCGVPATPEEESAIGTEFSDPEILAMNDEDMATTATEEALTNKPFGISGKLTAAQVKITPVLTTGLNYPSSLAFKPTEGSLWISNRGNDSTVIIDNPGKTTQKASRFYDDSAHFMNNPTQIAFSKLKPEFAVSLESVNDYNGAGRANYFTGVTLFTAERNLFEGGTMSHYDMLHHSPNSMGCAIGARPTSASQDMKEYWVFNGQAGAIDRYFFRKPHPLGADDHSDGQTFRYAVGGVKRVSGVPSHLAFDDATKILYIADTGNRRIAKLDTKTSIRGATQIAAYHSETPLYGVASTSVTAVTTSGLSKPSGLIIQDGMLVVSDNATGQILVYSKTGTLTGTVDTGLPGITGLAAGPDGKLYFANATKNAIYSLQVAQ